MNRKPVIKSMKKHGWTYQKIADYFGVSRQRIEQIHHNYSKKNKKEIRYYNELSKKLLKKDIKKVKNLGMNITKITGIKRGSRGRIRELVRIRDDHTCQLCEKKWKEGERRFDVHHLDCDNKKTRKCDKLEETDNMITLCHKCHLNLPEHREKIKNGMR